MMSYESIRANARDAQRRAKASRKQPKTFVGLGNDAIRDEIRGIPFLGKDRSDNAYAPKGWRRVDATNAPKVMACSPGYLFVDASGLGADDEPALSVRQFVEYIYNHRELGFGIVEAGQFQVVIATYERK